ncbi:MULTISPECIES: hypothetical protein [Streptomyces]|uniref:ATP-binding protein n=1 Tax=Streptomyces halstedii TaxID=1944 RepID=A0A6N9TX11_STRHA|nr:MULTISPECIES: hypothetical protein [Streptomyces]AWL40266.1 hypothetical protein B9S64_20910 [Streptomyces sp. SM18]MBV7670610.1 hypothetical protein [Streptomyces halstedii]MYQ52001.1 hypothetical protein [Streptomyces sp. SID4941]MYR74790.1 hypothetical protein [Streptomyces sp. SID4925]NEA16060.1 hypothetical protein [Streptomyces halstedii]
MARHALSKPRRRALLRAGLTLTALGAALGAGGAVAQAAPLPVPATGSDTVDGAVGAVGDAAAPAVTSALGYGLVGAVAPVADLQLDPLAGTGTDPLDNAVGTQIADFKPVTTALLTDPLTSGGSLGDLPVVGQVTGLITG